MSPNFFRKHIFALFFAFLLAHAPVVSAQQPAPDEHRKLPPVNYIRSRVVDVKHVAIDLRFDWDKEQAYGSTVVTLAPFKDTNKIYLDAAAMTVNSVTLAPGGAALKFAYDAKKADDNLEITLDRTVKRGEDVSVKVEYRTNYVNSADAETAIGSFGRGLRFIKPTEDNPTKPRQIWSQGETEFNRYWFPSYDYPNDFRTSELRATVDKPFTVVSNGRLVSVTDNPDNTRTFYWKMDIPYTNYLTSIVVGEYTEVRQEWGGIPIINYAYPSETKETAATVKNLPDMVRFFSEVTGVKYPYPKYAQTFVEDFGGGMENISATTMVKEMIFDERELLDGDSDSLQAHELAHQWFGDYVTTRDWGQIWLNESFATYFDALYHEHKKGREDFLYSKVRGNQESYFGTWNQGVRRPIVTNRYTNKDALFDTYAYPRGAAVLHMLRKHLGDEAFFKSLNHYLTSNAHQPVSTEDLRIAIEETTGQSMDWFFDQWLYKMGHPVFEVAKSYDDAKKQLTLTVRQTQKINPKDEYPQVEFFQTNVDVEIDDCVETVWIKPQAENVFTFNVATNPKLVNFDYEGTLIKELKFAKSTDELLYQAANDKDVLGKRWAMSELGKIAKNQQTSAADKERIMAALRSAAEKESFWRLRRAGLEEITAILSPQAPQFAKAPAARLDEATVQTLLKAAKDEKSQIRADAILLLGRAQEAKYADVYLAALNDRSYWVMQRAAVALAKTKSPQAYDSLLKLVNTESWRGRVRIAGLNGLAELEDKRALDTAIKYANDKMQPAQVRGAATTAVAASGKGDERAFPIIFDRFKKSLEANDFNGIFHGMQAFIRLADPRGQQGFDLMREKFKNNPGFAGTIDFFEKQFKAAIGK
ncbi:MAG: HEAT repeat domain-containing protein [Acidobacteriota bacterium]|nr:HEAT repeat domain-containing protein [Acidobacteriota bacterium]